MTRSPAESARGEGRRRGGGKLFIAALVCGAFGIGVSEFLVMGLLPGIAADLSPQLYASHPERAVAAAGGVVSGYALGVVAGMLITPWVLRRMSERATLAICAGAMLIWTLLTAASPNLAIAIALRFVAALTHATYVGLASSLVARRLGSAHHGRGAAIVVGGLSAANLVGVPILTAVGSGGQWRLVLGASALFFAVPVVALLAQPPEPVRSAAGRSGAGSHPIRGVGLTALTVTALASGCFAITTFVAPLSTWSQGEDAAIPLSILMLLFGVGMNAGNLVGGWSADRSADRTVMLSTCVAAIGAVAVLLPAAHGLGLGAGMLLVGLGLGVLTPGAQVLYMRAMGPESRLGASLAPGTINLGSCVGALLGAGALAVSGPAAVAVTALVLMLAGGGVHLVRRIGRAPLRASGTHAGGA